jgi:hypothetical protein
MSKWNILGGLCWATSAVLLLFQVIGKMMKEDYNWEMMSIVDVVDNKYLNWVNGIGVDLGRQAAEYIVNMPLYILLFAVGILFFLFSMFYKGR